MNMKATLVILVSVVVTLGGVGSPARAGAILELIPDNPGPYIGGESLTVDVWLHNNEDIDTRLRDIQFDFTDTDAKFLLESTFTFDYSSLPDDRGYQWRSPELPVPRTRNSLDCFCPGLFLPFPGNGSLHIGSIGAILPDDPGMYRMDMVNADEPYEGLGAQIIPIYSFVPWRSYTGEITGGVYDFEVIPEPATLSLLILGAVGVACRRRRNRTTTSGESGESTLGSARGAWRENALV